VTKETNNLALRRGRQVRDGLAYGCAVPRAYATLNVGCRRHNKLIIVKVHTLHNKRGKQHSGVFLAEQRSIHEISLDLQRKEIPTGIKTSKQYQ